MTKIQRNFVAWTGVSVIGLTFWYGANWLSHPIPQTADIAKTQVARSSVLEAISTKPTNSAITQTVPSEPPSQTPSIEVPREIRPGVSVVFDNKVQQVVRYRSGELLIGARASVTQTDVEVLVKSQGFKIVTRLPNNAFLLRGSNEVLLAARNAFELDKRIKFAEPNYLSHIAGEVSKDTYQESQVALRDLHVERAWKVATGSGITIAIVDTGVDLLHEDLRDNLVAGYDFVNADDSPDDDNGHGTACAGIAAARAFNGIGIAGVAPSAHIMPIKVLDERGWGSYVDIANGIRWATEHGAQVISISAGSYAPSRILAEAIDGARKGGAVVVASVGNDGTSTPVYPAALPGVLGVGALKESNIVADYSNTGDTVDVVTPGTGITATLPGNRYSLVGGTSMATASAAGVVALAMSAPANAGVRDFERFIRSRADSMGKPSEANRFGAGLPSAARAVGLDNEDSSITFVDVLPRKVTVGEAARLRFGVQNKRQVAAQVSAVLEIDGRSTDVRRTLWIDRQSTAMSELPLMLEDALIHRVSVRIVSDGDENEDNNSAEISLCAAPRGSEFHDVGIERVALVPLKSNEPMKLEVFIKNWGNTDDVFVDGVCTAQAMTTAKNGEKQPSGLAHEIGRINGRMSKGRDMSFSLPWLEVQFPEQEQWVSCNLTSADDDISNNFRTAHFSVSRAGEVRALYGGEAHHLAIEQAFNWLNLKRGQSKGIAFALDKTRDNMIKTFEDSSDDEDNLSDVNLNYQAPNKIEWAQAKWVMVPDPFACTKTVCTAWEAVASLVLPGGCIMSQIVGCNAWEDLCVCADKNRYMQTLDHFWDPDSDFMGINHLNFILNSNEIHPAVAKTRIHLLNAKYFYDRLAANVGDPIANQKSMYYYMGRVTHLVQDMTVPSHSHCDQHPAPLGDTDTFENILLEADHGWDAPRYQVTSGWPGNMSQRWLEVPSDEWKARNMSAAEAVDYLMFSNAQASQFFPSDDFAGEASVHPRFAPYLSNAMFKNRSPQAATDDYLYYEESVGPNVLPLAITSTASLWELLEREFVKPLDGDLDGIVNAADTCPGDFELKNNPVCVAYRMVATNW